MPTKRENLWTRIEEEFEEPVADVIMGLRGDGNSWRTVAGVLGVHQPTLLIWRKALGLPVDTHDKVRDPSSIPERKPLDEKARQLGYSGIVDAVTDMRLGQGLTIKQAAERLNCHWQSVSDNSPPGVRGTVNLSEEGLQARLRNLAPQWQSVPADNHPWRKDNEVLFDDARIHADAI